MKTILITGSGSGIGEAVARKLAGQCEHLVLHTGSNKTGLQHVGEYCEAAGTKVEKIIGDLCESQTVDALLSAGMHGEVSGVVLNAGFPDWKGFEGLHVADLERSMNVILTANFRLLHGLVASLKAARNGRVVAISSFLAHKFKVGAQVFPASAMAKAALERMMQSFAAEYAHTGLTANTIVPGYIKKNAPNHTPPDKAGLQEILNRIPAGRLGRSEEVAELTAFLLSDRAAYITGQSIHIDGGLLLQ